MSVYVFLKENLSWKTNTCKCEFGKPTCKALVDACELCISFILKYLYVRLYFLVSLKYLLNEQHKFKCKK